MQFDQQQQDLAALFTNLVQINRNNQAKQSDKANAEAASKRNSIFSASTEASNEQEFTFHFESFNDLAPEESEDSSPDSKKSIDDCCDDFFSNQESQSSTPKTQSKTKENKVWGEEEDELLKKLGIVYKNDWKKIVKRFKVLKNIKKSPVFLMKRFKELNGNQGDTRRHFNHQEDLLIAECMEKYGTNWMEIAKHVPERGAITIKNRYYSYIKKNNLLEKLIEEAKQMRQKENPITPAPLETSDFGSFEVNFEEANFIEYTQEPSSFFGESWPEYQSLERDFFGLPFNSDFDNGLRYF